MMDYFEIGKRIRRFRKACGISQEQLAEKIGISTTHMSHIETANTKLSLPVFIAITEALGVQADELLHDPPLAEKAGLKREALEVLDSCSPHDAHVLVDALKALKVSLEKYRGQENQAQ